MDLTLNLDELKKILGEAYNRGWKGSLDLCDSVVDEIAGRFISETPAKKQEQQQLLLFGTTSEIAEANYSFSVTVSTDGSGTPLNWISGGGDME